MMPDNSSAIQRYRAFKNTNPRNEILKLLNLLLALVLTVLLSSCNTLKTAEIQREISILAAELKLKESDIKILSSCTYGAVPNNIFKVRPNSGICAYTNSKEFHVRALDATTGQSSPLFVFNLKRVNSVAHYSGLISQLHFKLPQSVFVVELNRDEGPRTRNEGIAEMMNWMVADGYKQSEAPQLIQFHFKK